MPFCSLMKGITPTSRLLCFVLINSVFWAFYVFGSGFRKLAVIFVSDFYKNTDRTEAERQVWAIKKGCVFTSLIVSFPWPVTFTTARWVKTLMSLFQKTPQEFSNKQKGHTSKLLMSLSFNYLISSVFAANKRTGWELSFIRRFKCRHINSWDQMI